MEYQFKIQIKGLSKPPVWRKVIIPADSTFQRLHAAILIVFGWEGYHLFDFTDREHDCNIRISIPSEFDFEFDVKTQDATKVKLSKMFASHLHKMFYTYDFGDNWVHEITLEATTNTKSKEVICLAGKGNCPPEDCGGIYGYQDMKELFLTKPNSKEANGYKEWLGMEKDETWDAHAFDLDQANAILKYI